jgi:catechol 2,3-dioxygenase-like lactoylglutathione lyase family enzyme
VDWKLELIVVPVSDVDRAKAFYADQVGFTVDVDVSPTPQFRVVQLSPPGSACSIAFGTGIGSMEPGSLHGMHLIVSDIEAACAELEARGVEVGEMHHFEAGERIVGSDPAHNDYETFSSFHDPDGNTWVLQEVGHARSSGSS